MITKEWMELGYSEKEANEMVKLEKSEKQYEEYAHKMYYSKYL